MFTGIIEGMGEVLAFDRTEAGARLRLAAGPVAEGARIGDSVAINGTCLTVVALDGDRLEFEAVPETLRRTNLGELAAGARVNLERPLRAGGRLDGHIVQGHVDGTGHVAAVTPEGDSLRIQIAAEPELLRYVVEKGSIAVDGISLTVAAVDYAGFEVAIIPHTAAVTTLGQRAPGAKVNLEVDILAKYVERLLAPRLPQSPTSS